MAQVFSEEVLTPSEAAMAPQIISRPKTPLPIKENTIIYWDSAPSSVESVKSAEDFSRDDLLNLFRRSMSLRSRHYNRHHE